MSAEEFAEGVALPPRPYPGLRPFEKDEWAVYFGRERMADEIIAALIRRRLVFVHGDSGCGKSSLLRAGVFARLEQGSAGAPWRTATTLPRQAPLWNVATALAVLSGDGTQDARVIAWQRALQCGEDAPAAISELRSTLGSGPGCLLIDQFEELFQHARRNGPEEARLLTRALIALHRSPPEGLYLAMTMRSEYLGACARYEGFAELVNATQYLLPRMGREDILRAIREPATMYGGQVSRELAERLIADSGGGQDQLPLIQHGLMRLYERRSAAGDGTWQLAIEDFPRAGGLAAMLSAHADEVAARLRTDLDPVHGQRLVADLFRALTDTNADNQAIRRPLSLAQLGGVLMTDLGTLRTVIDRFRADGVSLLSPHGDRPLGPEDLVDVSHEALIRCWSALADPKDGWLVREFRNGLVWRALLVQADSFERDPANVLASTTTTERELWLQRRNPNWAERDGGGWQRVQRLISASAAARDKARAAEIDALHKEGRAAVLRNGIAALAVLVGLLVTALFYAYAQIHESKLQFASLEATRQRNLDLIAELDAATARSTDFEARLNSTAIELESFRKAAADLKADTAKGTVAATIDLAVKDLSAQADKIARAVIDNSAQTAPAPTVVLGPRLYMHIAESGQRAAAQTLESYLENTPGKLGKLVVPGIELVKVYPSSAALRCFEAEECRQQASALLTEINARLISPQVKLQVLSDRYGGSTAIRAGHFELWFPPGKIELKQ